MVLAFLGFLGILKDLVCQYRRLHILYNFINRVFPPASGGLRTKEPEFAICSEHRGLGLELAGKLPSEEGHPRPFLA